MISQKHISDEVKKKIKACKVFKTRSLTKELSLKSKFSKTFEVV